MSNGGDMARPGVVGPLSQSPAAALQNMMRGGGGTASNTMPSATTPTASSSPLSSIASSPSENGNHLDRTSSRKKVSLWQQPYRAHANVNNTGSKLGKAAHERHQQQKRSYVALVITWWWQQRLHSYHNRSDTQCCGYFFISNRRQSTKCAFSRSTSKLLPITFKELIRHRRRRRRWWIAYFCYVAIRWTRWPTQR